MEMARGGGPAVKAQLGLWDAVSIIVGIVIGTTIYKSPQLIMANVASPAWGLGAWALGGALSVVGALCYAELASTYPRSGGDYVYLSRAFGPWCGFLFGWAQLAVILTGSIGMMAFVFGDYAVQVWNPPEAIGSREMWTAILAAGAVVVLSLTNILGVVLGKWTQNLLSLLKVIGLGAIVVVGFKHGSKDILAGPAMAPDKTSFGMAMIFVLYAYGGWNDAAFVAAEVRNRRNIIRALILGTGLVTVIYLAVNVAYLQALGFEGMRSSWTVAADVGKMVPGIDGSLAISILVMVSALGAINGLIFTGSRLYSTLGAENSIFALLGRWSPRFGSPVWALLIQAAISVVMIAAIGTPVGRDAIDVGMKGIGLEAMPWKQYFGGFDTLLSGTAPVFWAFFLLSGLSLFALRQRDPDIERPFRVPLFPLLPLIFCGTCAYMLYSAIDYAKYIALIGAVPLAIGLPLYWLSRRTVTDGVKGD
jgi:basic amino acid/polyamine antiporter, APA family